MTGLGRRAKYLMADLASGDVLLMHLGMSGSFRVVKDDGKTAPGQFHHPRSEDRAHDHVVFHMSSGAAVVFNDPRRFGYMKIIARNAIEDEPLLQGLGPEPLGNEFDAAMLARSCANKKTSLKAALLDQRVVAGLGNIYVCEALFRAHLSPRRLAATLATKKGEPTDHARRLVAPSTRCSIRRSRPAARRCAIIARPPANSAISSTRSRSTTAKARNARPQAAAASCGASPRTAARPSGARSARSELACVKSRRRRVSAAVRHRDFAAPTAPGRRGRLVRTGSPETSRWAMFGADAGSSLTTSCVVSRTRASSAGSPTHCHSPRISSADLPSGAIR